MYIPKKLKWDTLGAFKKFLESDTKEKILSYNGYELVTETTKYGIIDSQLNCRPNVVITETEVPKFSRKRKELEPIVPVKKTTKKKTSKIVQKPKPKTKPKSKKK